MPETEPEVDLVLGSTLLRTKEVCGSLQRSVAGLVIRPSQEVVLVPALVSSPVRQCGSHPVSPENADDPFLILPLD